MLLKFAPKTLACKVCHKVCTETPAYKRFSPKHNVFSRCCARGCALARFGVLWAPLARSGALWAVLGCFGPLWAAVGSLGRSEQLWGALGCPESFNL